MQVRLGRWALVLLASASLGPQAQAQAQARAQPQAASIAPAAMRPVGKVDPRFQSYNVEMAELVGGRFWAPFPKAGAKSVAANTQRSGGLDLAPRMFREREPLELRNNPRLRNLAAALGPAYIRISGSWANTVYFQDDDRPRLEKPPAGFQNVLTRAQWAGAVEFAKAVDAKIVTSFAVSPGVRDANGAWDPDQARRLLRYTRELGGEIDAAALINEPNLAAIGGLPRGYDPAAFARDIATFRAFVAQDAPGARTVGPGSSSETGASALVKRGLKTQDLMSAEPKPQFDVFNYHFYGTASQRCAATSGGGTTPDEALGEEWLARTDAAFDFYKALRDRFTPGAPIWLTETAQASCGGDVWAASFLDSFRYVDQMGRLAKRGVSAIFHNTLAASDYGLIEEDTWTPRPNYWAALLWRRLMAETVLDAGVAEPGLHVYAHCLRGRAGGVALVALNLDRTKAAALQLPTSAERYTLSADELQGSSVKLNGRPLRMAGDRLPALRPASAGKGALKLEPATITFLALPEAANPACS